MSATVVGFFLPGSVRLHAKIREPRVVNAVRGYPQPSLDG